jgi:hypothetical protein
MALAKNEALVIVDGREYVIRKFTGFDALKMFKDVTAVIVPALSKLVSGGSMADVMSKGIDADIDFTEAALMLLDGPRGDRMLEVMERLLESCLYNGSPITKGTWETSFEDTTFTPVKLAVEVVRANWGGRVQELMATAQGKLRQSAGQDGGSL